MPGIVLANEGFAQDLTERENTKHGVARSATPCFVFSVYTNTLNLNRKKESAKTEQVT